MKAASNKLARERAAYRKRVKSFLEENRVCPIMFLLKGKVSITTEIHHAKSRHGKLLNDERFWYALSDLGHGEVHRYPHWARFWGFIVTKGYGLHDELEARIVAKRRALDFSDDKEYDELIKAIMPEWNK